ncbi:ketoacyl-synt, Ketoacyl-synt C, PS-DH and/or Thiolase N domain containing protein [Asbolus verrucosus]|uniref:Ketoacyl-synt, Ketoacyl-synt C, PS-DH and/or Thiolase N domain containing protein n=1 Tax=Asbolus verrucosus TaxID=1661398 RepID=A0A482V7H8_ASBVE|nr:ketoacyl-synt, Ketoacyl-synt C, PS-DH and/or Thiolase N domain containing protein [Asbolus verrucosus]
MTDYFFGRWLSNPAPGDEVVITGMSGRLPECNNIHEFRDRLFNKEDMVMSDDRRWSLNHPEVPQKIAKIYDIDKIDCGFFGLHYRQANTMDVMMRKFLEVAVEAVLDAGVNPSELEGSKTGVFVGACFSEMEIELLMKITEPQMMGLTGYLRSFVANRLSYFLKLKGPSYTFDTACSSSMNALEHAFKAIRCGQCDSAIVGGVNILLHPGVTSEFFRLGVLSSDGRCKVFDQEADGYVRGEAVACIFLQKSKDAKKIYAQVLHTKLNCDGFKPLGITYPSNQMQDKLMTEVLEESGFGPSDVSFLEMHGTGTEVGDLQEEAAVDCALGKKRQKPLLVGSVKSSIGHTEPASGLCSIIKVIIAMETGLIAPNINLNKIKEGMEGFEQGRLNAVTELTELEGEEAIVGINNFGFGGNNSHLLLRRFNKKKVNGGLPDDDIPRLICVSGRTEESLQEILDNLNHNPIDCEFVSLLHDLFSKNILNHLYRGYTIISNDGPLKSSVKFFGEQQPPLYIYFGQFDRSFKILGKYLLNFPVFKATMESINKYLLPKNINIIDTILKDGEMSNNLLGMIAVQIGIVDIFKLLELNPTAVYSLGKLVSAYYYEALTLEEAILIAAESPNFDEIFTNLKPSTAKRHNRYFNKYYNSLIKIETFPENLEGSLSIVPKNLTILNISDTSLNYKDFLLVENNTVTFLNALGGLYEQGHSLQLHRLYPKIQYPVSRGTPMISPLIKWKSDKSWYTYKYNSFYTLGESEQKEFQLTNLREECKFLTGHVIDGRTLIPATQYLNMVWETFLHCRRLPPKETPILFKNVRFIRAVMLPKTFYVSLWVNIQKGSGKFEVLENGSVVVTGWISSPKDVGLYRTDLAPLALEEDPTLVLEQDEIYRELYIRGYNYRQVLELLVMSVLTTAPGVYLKVWRNAMLKQPLVWSDGKITG